METCILVSCPLSATKFGAMLDMLTDRCATMCLLVNLSLLYPSYTFLFQLSMTLDVASHWLHLHRYAAPSPT